MKKHFMVALTGAFIGIAAVVLVKFGNPGNMGFCIACFLRGKLPSSTFPSKSTTTLSSL